MLIYTEIRNVCVPDNIGFARDKALHQNAVSSMNAIWGVNLSFLKHLLDFLYMWSVSDLKRRGPLLPRCIQEALKSCESYVWEIVYLGVNLMERGSQISLISKGVRFLERGAHSKEYGTFIMAWLPESQAHTPVLRWLKLFPATPGMHELTTQGLNVCWLVTAKAVL